MSTWHKIRHIRGGGNKPRIVHGIRRKQRQSRDERPPTPVPQDYVGVLKQIRDRLDRGRP
jgi:hypothetical protein